MNAVQVPVLALKVMLIMSLFKSGQDVKGANATLAPNSGNLFGRFEQNDPLAVSEKSSNLISQYKKYSVEIQNQAPGHLINFQSLLKVFFWCLFS